MRKRLAILTLLMSFAFAAGAMALQAKPISADAQGDTLSVSAVGLIKPVKGNPETAYGINTDYTLSMYKNPGASMSVNSGNGLAFTVDKDFKGYPGVKVVAAKGDEISLGTFVGNFSFAFSFEGYTFGEITFTITDARNPSRYVIAKIVDSGEWDAQTYSRYSTSDREHWFGYNGNDKKIFAYNTPDIEDPSTVKARLNQQMVYLRTAGMTENAAKRNVPVLEWNNATSTLSTYNRSSTVATAILTPDTAVQEYDYINGGLTGVSIEQPAFESFSEYTVSVSVTGMKDLDTKKGTFFIHRINDLDLTTEEIALSQTNSNQTADSIAVGEKFEKVSYEQNQDYSAAAVKSTGRAGTWSFGYAYGGTSSFNVTDAFGGFYGYKFETSDTAGGAELQIVNPKKQNVSGDEKFVFNDNTGMDFTFGGYTIKDISFIFRDTQNHEIEVRLLADAISNPAANAKNMTNMIVRSNNMENGLYRTRAGENWQYESGTVEDVFVTLDENKKLVVDQAKSPTWTEKLKYFGIMCSDLKPPESGYSDGRMQARNLGNFFWQRNGTKNQLRAIASLGNNGRQKLLLLEQDAADFDFENGYTLTARINECVKGVESANIFIHNVYNGTGDYLDAGTIGTNRTSYTINLLPGRALKLDNESDQYSATVESMRAKIQTPPSMMPTHSVALKGEISVSADVNVPYIDAGATGSFTFGGETYTVDLQKPVQTYTESGRQTVVYTFGNQSVSRAVTVGDTVAPKVCLSSGIKKTEIHTLTETDNIRIAASDVTATDNVGGPVVSIQIKCAGDFAAYSDNYNFTAGNHTVRYTATDSSGNSAYIDRYMVVTETPEIPAIRLESQYLGIADRGASVAVISATSAYPVSVKVMFGEREIPIVANAFAAANDGVYKIIYETGEAGTEYYAKVECDIAVSEVALKTAGKNVATATTGQTVTLEKLRNVSGLCDENKVTVKIISGITDVSASVLEGYAFKPTKAGTYSIRYIYRADGKEYVYTDEITVTDATKPVIEEIYCPTNVEQGGFVRLLYKVTDNSGEDIAPVITVASPSGESTVVSGNGFTAVKRGTYTVKANAADSAGNRADEITKTVIVEDTTKPIIRTDGIPAKGVLHAEIPLTIDITDNSGEDIAPVITVTFGGESVEIVDGGFIADKVGDYTVTVTATDSAGNHAVATVTVTVEADTIKPVITVVHCPETATKGDNVTLSFTVTDNSGEDITPVITVTFGGESVGIVDGGFIADKVGDYTVTVTATDSAGNTEEITKTITVTEPVEPDNPPNPDGSGDTGDADDMGNSDNAENPPKKGCGCGGIVSGGSMAAAIAIGAMMCILLPAVMLRRRTRS